MSNTPNTSDQVHQQAIIEEWKSLQHSYDRYEGLSLGIKALAITVFVAATIAGFGLLLLLLIGLCWLQEAIWKTFQSRTEDRMLVLEHAWQKQEFSTALSFYNNWQDHRPGTRALISTYLKNAFRPTIAYPYAVLMVFALVI